MVNYNKERYGFSDLLEIMKVLRAPGGCPWDAEQTHKSIRRNFIEEVYEAVEGIDTENDTLLCEELGDVLLQVVFHAQIAQDRQAFSIGDVCDGVCKKLILRHPHIFAKDGAKLSSSEQVLNQWDQIKKTEKNQKSVSDEMEQVAKTLPALIYAEKILKKAEKSGINASLPEPCTDEEIIGDRLLSVVAEARKSKIDPEEALMKRVSRLIKEFYGR